MSNCIVNIFLEDHDTVTASILEGTETLVVSLGYKVALYLERESEHYDHFVGLFIQHETAPGDQPETAPLTETSHP